MNAIIEDALAKLKSGIEELVQRIDRAGLSPQELSAFEHDLHEGLGQVGRAAVKAVLEDADVEARAVDQEGCRHYFKYKGPQDYECLFGKIEVNRSVYQANGDRSICPIERNSGIVHHHLTPSAAELVSYCVSQMVPREVVEFCKKWQFLKPCETVIKLVAAEVGESVEMLQELYEAEIEKHEATVPEKTSIVTFSQDGSMVNIREERWREAMTGSVSFYGQYEEKVGDDDVVTRERLKGVYVAQMPEEKHLTFEEKFEREIQRALSGIDETCRIACIADGALSNWRFFENHPQLKDTTHINDFYHAASYLKDVADALFGKGSSRAAAWFKKYRRVLKKEDCGVEKVIRSIRYHKAQLVIRSRERADTIHKSLRYFTRNRSRMDYAEYRRQNLPIGSGVVEAACKTVVGHRLKRPGMRWSVEGGQSILNLRTIVLSRRWDAFWKCHQEVLAIPPIAA